MPTGKNGHLQAASGKQLTFNGLGADKKLRGGYYTPHEIAHFLAKWAVRRASTSVLEPSAGDGRIVAAAASRIQDGGEIVAVELHRSEAEKAATAGGSRATVIKGDFFKWFKATRPDGSFDAVVGNPPFIRYQDFPEAHRQPAFALMEEEGLHPSRLTNAWLPFVTAATQALRPGGRLALVLPAELLQVMYAAELREYLVRKYSDLTIVTFRRLVFDGIQQEVILLLGIRRETCGARISFLELDGISELTAKRVISTERVTADLDHAREKWTQYYLSEGELGLIRALEGSRPFKRLGELAEVDVGIVTGRNEFFVLNQEQAKHYDVTAWCIPLVGRSVQIPGLTFGKRDWRQIIERNDRGLLVQFGDVERSKLPAPALKYVKRGEENEIHQGYKCRVRLPRWWNLPSAWAPDGFLLRQIHDGPRIIENKAGATCTDTIHRVRMTNGVSSGSLAAVSSNSLTFAFAEILGRSYGGGVLELEPTEAERLPIPNPEDADFTAADVDALARQGHVQRLLCEVDRRVLPPLGLTRSEINTLRGIWQKLRERRVSRRRR